MKSISFIFAGLALLASRAEANVRCPYSNARYLVPGGRFEMAFYKVRRESGQINDLTLRIRDNRSRKSLVFYYFDQGSAPQIQLISTTDPSVHGWHITPDGGVRPHGTATFLAMDQTGRLEQTAPMSTTSASNYIIVPELGQLLKTTGISSSRNDAFVFASCSWRAPSTVRRASTELR